MKNILFFFLSLLLIYPLKAQNEHDYTESMSEINDYLLSESYLDALPMLIDLEKKGFKGGNVEYKIGYCYLNIPGDEMKSISYFKKAAEDLSPKYSESNLDEKKAPLETFLSLGDAYRLTNQFDEAGKYYHIYLSRLDCKDEISRAIAQKRINECLYAKVMVSEPIKARLVNMGQSVNTGLANSDACISGDGKTMVFIRRKKFYDAVYTCSLAGSGWSEPEEITTKLGSDGEFYPTSLSYDGAHMLLESFGNLSGEDIYESNKVDGKWQKVKKLEFQVSSKFNDVDAVYAPDGKSVYFSSNRDGGKGGYDIYTSTRDAFGHWSYVKNLGSPVNTPFDERSPCLFDHGNILVFSSNAEPNMGGYDYFYAIRDSATGRFTNICNVGYPINSSGDDLGLKLENKPGIGVLTRHTADGFTDDDIFWVKYSGFSNFHLIRVNGKLTRNGKPLASPIGYSLAFIDKSIEDTVDRVLLDDAGNYTVSLYPGDFILKIKYDGGEQENDFKVPEVKARLYTLNTNLKSSETPVSEKHLVAVALPDTVFIHDIRFAFNKYRIALQDTVELHHLASELKHYKITRILLIGYTDILGNSVYNKHLSYLRALEIQKYLQKFGISRDIIHSEGKGSANFVAINKNPDGSDNPRGRSYNRRVEVRVISGSKKIRFIHKNDVPAGLQVKH